MSATRLCGCGCGASLLGRRANVRYADDRHRQRAYRGRLRAALAEAGLPVRLNLSATATTRNRRGDGRSSSGRVLRRRQPRPDLRISYRRAVVAIAALLEEWYDPPLALRVAEANLRPLLPPSAKGAA